MAAAVKRLRSFFLRVAYLGGDFAGWQVQRDQRTVQGELEAAVAKIAGEPIFVRGAGRTDAGVHARAQAASMRMVSRIEVEKLAVALNSLLPVDLSVTSAQEVPLGFDAKRHSIGKRYVYRVLAGGPRDPFCAPTVWHVRQKLDVEAMDEATAAFVGEHDYESFRAASCQAAHARRCLWKVALQREGRELSIEVRGNAFCQHMIRIIAGTLVDVGRGRFAAREMASILEARDRRRAGITAPAQGLTMEQVYFPDEGAEAEIPEGWSWPGWPPSSDAWPPADAVRASPSRAAPSESDD